MSKDKMKTSPEIKSELDLIKSECLDGTNANKKAPTRGIKIKLDNIQYILNKSESRRHPYVKAVNQAYSVDELFSEDNINKYKKMGIS